MSKCGCVFFSVTIRPGDFLSVSSGLFHHARGSLFVTMFFSPLTQVPLFSPLVHFAFSPINTLLENGLAHFGVDDQLFHFVFAAGLPVFP